MFQVFQELPSLRDQKQIGEFAKKVTVDLLITCVAYDPPGIFLCNLLFGICIINSSLASSVGLGSI